MPWAMLAAAALEASKPSPLMPGMASSGAPLTSTFDSSGWNVNYGSGGITSNRDQGGATPWQTYALVALGLVLAWKTLKHIG